MEEDKKLVKTGRGGKYNFPQAVPPEEPDVARAVLGSVLHWYKRGNESKCNTSEEVAARCEEYITDCYETGQRMTVEKLALALGITRETLWKWEQMNDERSNIIKKAKDTIASYDADLVTSGKMNPVPYIFRAKNYYGMRDQVDIVASPGGNLADVPADEVVNKYRELPE